MNVRARRMLSRSTAAAIALVVGALLHATASAQTVEAEWSLYNGIFLDDRVTQSMRLQMDTDAAASAGGVSLTYRGGQELFAPPEDALVLLMAAGLMPHEGAQVTGLEVTRACRVWSGGEGVQAGALAATAAALGAELARVWTDLGLPVGPCEKTDDPATADLLVYPVGAPPAGVDFMAGDFDAGFIAIIAPAGGPPPGQGGGTGGGAATGTTTLDVPDPDQPNLLPGTTNLDYFGERYALFAAGELCVTGEVPADGGGFTVVLGEEGQPAACATSGGLVEVAGTRTGPFFFTSTVTPGATVILDNWAPYPPGTPYPAYVCAWLGDEGAAMSGCASSGVPLPADSGSLGEPRSTAPWAAVLGVLVSLSALGAARRTTRVQ